MIKRSPIARFSEKYKEDPDTGCWTWTANCCPDGYGMFRARARKNMGAHRFAYEAFVGPIPEGLQIDHLCRNRACVNPAHMEAVTKAENNRRGLSPTAINGRKRACVRGHRLEGPNVIERPDGGRECRECARRRGREWARKHRALAQLRAARDEAGGVQR